MAYNKLHPIALGLTLAALSGPVVFIAGLLVNIVFNGKPVITTMGAMYLTFNPTIQNCAIAGFGASVGASIAGYIAAWIYNILSAYIEKEPLEK